ncbi:MAG: DUF4442 domain-containing protein [Bdellovibrionales bacterium]|nr:DUF4442 domain-containing protein [Bdellovibrionales bacterium]
MVGKRNLLLKFLNFWPPFLGAGIRVKRFSKDFREVDVEMHLHRWNTNYVGVHYGGSLYSMADPFYMLMLLENLGPEYVVWDKAAQIRFRKPGRGLVRAKFRLSQEQIDQIKLDLVGKEKIEPTFKVEIHDTDGVLVAEVDKVIHVRRKAK